MYRANPLLQTRPRNYLEHCPYLQGTVYLQGTPYLQSTPYLRGTSCLQGTRYKLQDAIFALIFKELFTTCKYL